MTAHLCVGGPWHGKRYEADDFESEFVMEEIPELEMTYELTLIYFQNRPVRHTYRRRGIGPNCIVWLHSSIPVTL